MPPKIKYTKDDIINSAFNLVREKGLESLSARNLAFELKSSPQPIFSYFENMDEVKKAVFDRAVKEYKRYTDEEISLGKYTVYKSMGMAYIKFARCDKHLFKMLFMCDNKKYFEQSDIIFSEAVDFIERNFSIPNSVAEKFHLEIWIFVHGIASMYATDYLDFDEETVSELISDIFNGLKLRFEGNL